MKKPRKCRKCGCTENKACIEFDAEGRGRPCGWSEDDSTICTACEPEPLLMHLRPPLVVAPQLAGMIARHR